MELQFLSNMAFSIKPPAARSAGYQNNELLKQRSHEKQPGKFLLEQRDGDALVLAPYVDDAMIESLLAQSEVQTEALSIPLSEAPSDELPTITINPGRKPLDSKSELSKSLLIQQKNQTEIVPAVFGVPSSGRAFNAAVEAYRAILAELVQQE